MSAMCSTTVVIPAVLENSFQTMSALLAEWPTCIVGLAIHGCACPVIQDDATVAGRQGHRRERACYLPCVAVVNTEVQCAARADAAGQARQADSPLSSFDAINVPAASCRFRTPRSARGKKHPSAMKLVPAASPSNHRESTSRCTKVVVSFIGG